MKKRTIALGTLVVLVASVFIFKEPIKETIYAHITEDMFVTSDSDAFDPGLSIGDSFPSINALHKGQPVTELNQFKGENGTILMASRSFDWCPFCIKQMIELEQNKALFEQAGIGLVAMTYDAPELQEAFVNKHQITIPVLSDVQAQTFKALDILNADYGVDDDNYGLPYPGMFIINSDGVIVGKLFVEAYSSRVDAQSSFAYASKALNRGQ